MFQLPKQEHVTLPSVENWYTNTNILKLPPKAVFTRRKDKVGEDLQITGWIDDSGDRACEGIMKYARGVNPMVSVSYSNRNAGTNANPLSYSKHSDGKLPYRIMDAGAFRPPVLTQEDLFPLSRLPRNRTSVMTNPEFPNYLKKIEAPQKLRAVKQEVLQTSVRPSAYLKMERPRCGLTESKYCIKKEIPIIPVSSNIRMPEAAVTRIIEQSNFNPDKYIKEEMLEGNIQANVSSGYLKNIEFNKGFDRGIKDEIAIISYVPNLKGDEKVTYLETEIELERKTPIYQMTTNIGGNGMTSVDTISSRDKYLRPTLQKGGFENIGFIPKTERENMIKDNVVTEKSNINKFLSKMTMR